MSVFESQKAVESLALKESRIQLAKINRLK